MPGTDLAPNNCESESFTKHANLYKATILYHNNFCRNPDLKRSSIAGTAFRNIAKHDIDSEWDNKWRDEALRKTGRLAHGGDPESQKQLFDLFFQTVRRAIELNVDSTIRITTKQKRESERETNSGATSPANQKKTVCIARRPYMTKITSGY